MSLTKASYSMITGAPANVLDYGADPTGIADSTTAIQAALTASSMVYIPAGTYKVTSTLTMQSVYQKQSVLIGAGFGFTILNWAGSTSGTMLTNSTRSSLRIEGLSFVNTVAQGTTSCIVATGGFEYGEIKNCRFSGFNAAISMGTLTGSDSYFNTITENLIESCGYGVYMLATGSLPCNSNWITRNKFNNVTNGIYVAGGAITCDFSYNDFEGTTTNGIYAEANDCTFINNHFEVGAGNSINLASGLYNFIVNPSNAGGSGTFVNSGTSTTIFSPRANATIIPVQYLTFPTSVTNSSNSYTLDDYRKNQTFTPVFNGWTNVGTPTVVAKYTKIGNVVYFNIVVTPATSISSTATTSYLTGLPYTPSTSFSGSSVNTSTQAAYSVQINAFSGGAIYTGTTGVLTVSIAISGFYTI